MSVYAQGIKFELVECCECSTPMMMSSHMMRRLKESKKDFYCVACGQMQGWHGKTANEKELESLKRAVDQERSWRHQAEQQERHAKHQVRAQKAAKTKLKKRIHNGVCPCCNRHFTNLQNHMHNKHPEYVEVGSGDGVVTLRGTRTKLGLTQSQVADECGIKPQYVSMYENEKPTPVEAKQSIEQWIDKHA